VKKAKKPQAKTSENAKKTPIVSDTPALNTGDIDATIPTENQADPVDLNIPTLNHDTPSSPKV